MYNNKLITIKSTDIYIHSVHFISMYVILGPDLVKIKWLNIYIFIFIRIRNNKYYYLKLRILIRLLSGISAKYLFGHLIDNIVVCRQGNGTDLVGEDLRHRHCNPLRAQFRYGGGGADARALGRRGVLYYYQYCDLTPPLPLLKLATARCALPTTTTTITTPVVLVVV